MSAFSVPVLEYVAEPHPNADALELAVIGGWRAACRIGQFKSGQKVAYIPEGSLLPWDLVVELNLHDPPRLAGPDRNRVKAIRLRGVLSQGIVYGGDRIAALSAGDDATDVLGVIKWVPPVPVHMSGLMEPGPKIGYDIDNIKSWPGRMIEGEEVVVTEKLHGSFCCLGLRRGEQGARPEPVVSSKGQLGRGLRFIVDAEDNADNLYVKAWSEHAEAINREFDRRSADADISAVYFFGEVCGPKVQDLAYGLQQPRFHAFDLRLDSGYASWDEMSATAERVGLSTVPVLWRGPWSDGLLAEHTDGVSSIAGHHREGIVVRPADTRYDTGADHPSGRGPGRVILKSVSERHLLRKGGTEYH